MTIGLDTDLATKVSAFQGSMNKLLNQIKFKLIKPLSGANLLRRKRNL